VQEKAVAFPTDARLIHRARERLVRLATKHGVLLRQSYERIGKHALIMHQRYAHAKQFKRANKSLRKLRTFLGRVERDIARRIKGDDGLREIFRRPLYLAERVREQRQKQRGKKVFRCMRPKSNASAKARRIVPTSSASRCRGRRRCMVSAQRLPCSGLTLGRR
jgi:IS5 family transposase